MGSQSGRSAQPGAGHGISPTTAGVTETIEGEVLRIQGDIYIVKDTSGKEVRLHVDKNTNIDGNITPKDLIIARASRMSATPGDVHRSTDPNQGTWSDRSQSTTGDRNPGMSTDRSQSTTGDRNQGMTGDRNRGMSGDRHQGLSSDHSQSVTWHADSIKKR
jgi:hypothetical protein